MSDPETMGELQSSPEHEPAKEYIQLVQDALQKARQQAENPSDENWRLFDAARQGIIHDVFSGIHTFRLFVKAPPGVKCHTSMGMVKIDENLSEYVVSAIRYIHLPSEKPSEEDGQPAGQIDCISHGTKPGSDKWFIVPSLQAELSVY